MEFKNNLQLKKISEDDYSEVVNLVNSSYRGDSSRLGWTTEAEYLDGQRTDLESLKNELQDQNKTLLCLRTNLGAEIIGTVLLEPFGEPNQKTCYLGMLTVKPTLQNQGLGRWIMKAAESYARERGALYMTLGVLNPRAELVGWYERRGYQRTGQRENFPDDHAKFGYPKIKDLHFLMFKKTL